ADRAGAVRLGDRLARRPDDPALDRRGAGPHGPRLQGARRGGTAHGGPLRGRPRVERPRRVPAVREGAALRPSLARRVGVAVGAGAYQPDAPARESHFCPVVSLTISPRSLAGVSGGPTQSTTKTPRRMLAASTTATPTAVNNLVGQEDAGRRSAAGVTTGAAGSVSAGGLSSHAAGRSGRPAGAGALSNRDSGAGAGSGSAGGSAGGS